MSNTSSAVQNRSQTLSTLARVATLEWSDESTVLRRVERDTPIPPLVLRHKPDVASARRRLGSARRISDVFLTINEAGYVSGHIRGVRSRHLFSTPVPLTVALGLAELGVRTWIADNEQLPSVPG
jgi:hypothetical protein